MLQWIDILRIEDTVVKQVKSNSKLNCRKFDFTLLNHQRILLKSMISLETSCRVKVIKQGVIYRININEGYYLDPIHTGRSVCILSLIKYDKKIVDLNTTPIKVNSPTIILTNDMDKWINNNDVFTKLSIYKIGSIAQLNKFKLLTDKEINSFTIILINNGKYKSKFIINMFSIYFQHICWNRLIIDDFDVISYPSKYYKINYLFIWYISYHFINSQKMLNYTDTTINVINKPENKFYNILKYVEANPFIKYVTIETESKLLLESMNLNNSSINKYVTNNYDINYKAIIKNNLLDDINNMRRFYNDYDLFKFINILNCKYEVFNNLFNDIDILSYYKIKKVINFINNYLSLDIGVKPYDESYNYTEEDLTTYKTIEKYNSNVQAFLHIMLYKYKFMIYDINNILLRLHNISSECEICYESFSVNNYAIYKCCKHISCEMCYLNLFKMTQTDTILCPFCRNELNFINSLIVVNKDIKFDQYLYLENVKNIVIKVKSIKTRSIDNIINNILNKTNTYEYDIIMSKLDINQINLEQFCNTYDTISIVELKKNENCQKILILINDYFKCFSIYEKLKHCSILISDFYKFNTADIIYNKIIKCIFVYHTNLFNSTNYKLMNYITDIIVISNDEQDVFNNKTFLNLLLLSKLVIKNINIHSIVHFN